jgi:hypothetical protein
MGRSRNRGGKSLREKLNNKRKYQQQRLRHLEDEEEARAARQATVRKIRQQTIQPQEQLMLERNMKRQEKVSVLKNFLVTAAVWLISAIIVIMIVGYFFSK